MSFAYVSRYENFWYFCVVHKILLFGYVQRESVHNIYTRGFATQIKISIQLLTAAAVGVLI